jgi:drug/metabolite transporter (DMT)-like permease
LATFNALWTVSVAQNGAAISTVLVYCSAGFTVVLGWWFLNEPLDVGKIVAVVLSLCGCVLVAGAWNPTVWRTNVLGIVTGIISGLGYAAYSLMGRRASQRGLNPWTTLLYTFGFAAAFLLLFNLFPGDVLPGVAARPADFLWLGNSLAGWGVLFALAAGPTIAGYWLYNVSLSYLPSGVANLIVSLEPAITAAIAYVLLGERFTGVQVGGSVMIMAGVAFLRIYEAWATTQVEHRSKQKVETAIAS